MDGIIWDLNPTIVHLGPLQLRYYGIIFASMLYIGFVFWKKQALRGGFPEELADRYLVWGVMAVILGARLGHCLFYEPERYLSNPITILYFWKGGLASHGAIIAVPISLILFALKYKTGILETLDRCTMSSAVAAAAVRLGNFFNSEIVGRPTDVPWAVRFPWHDCRHQEMCSAAIPRHPSQLYEFAFGLFVLATLYFADKKAGEEKRPLGMMTGIFLGLYSFGRFMVEFVKEYQVDKLIEGESFLTMGQYLSIVPFVIGTSIFIWAMFISKTPTDSVSKIKLIVESEASQTKSASKTTRPQNKKRKSRRKKR